MNIFQKIILSACALITSDLYASFWTQWTEISKTAPIYNPDPGPLAGGEDYFPYVVFDANKFNGDGAAFLYKMWQQGPGTGGAPNNGGFSISYSNDGVNWTLGGPTNLANINYYHICVLYDKNRFGGGAYPYKAWFWDFGSFSTIDDIKFTQSLDGITWTTPVAVTQDPAAPLVTGGPGYFTQLYGPGFLIYNPRATSTPGQPYSFPYVMFFDTASSIPANTMNPTEEQIGLAYSQDGLFWHRFGDVPLALSPLNPTAWDFTHMFRPSIYQSPDGTYHMFYSGSNEFIDPATTVVYAHGIGYASSPDGINWTKDPNPIFIYSDGVAWRNSRTYTPFVLVHQDCSDPNHPNQIAQMWFTGGTGLITGANQGIGYAVLDFLPPVNARGCVIKNRFLNKTECYVKAAWDRSPALDVTFYRIYDNTGQVVTKTGIKPPLTALACLPSCRSSSFSVAAVTNNLIESCHVPLSLVPCPCS